MKKTTLFLLLLFSASIVYAQQGLLFTNTINQKEVLMTTGDLVKFSYNGYIGQREIKSGVILSIEDSIVGVMAPVSSGKMSMGLTEVRYIYVKDITGFRKFHKSRPYLMSLSNIAITVGAVFLFYTIDKNTDLTFAEKFGLSLGTGIVSTLIVRGAFPERIKNKIGEGWEVKVLK